MSYERQGKVQGLTRAALSLCALLTALFCCKLPAAAEEAPSLLSGKVESVTVHLDLSSGYVGAETLGKLEQALQDTVELALVEQLEGDLAYISRHLDEVVETLGEVIESSLAERGFTLEEMVLRPGEQTTVELSLRLAESQVQDFAVRFYVEGSTELLQTVIASDAETISGRLYSTVAQTPYSDSLWLSRMVRESVEASLAAMPAYDEFEQSVIVEPGETTSVAVILTPQSGAEQLTSVNVRAHSYTLLNNEVEPVRDELFASLHSLTGLPLGFVRTNLGAIQRAAYQQLVNSPAMSCICADADVEMQLTDCELSAELRPNSTERMLALSGRVDLWEHSDGETFARTDARGGIFISDDVMLMGALSWFPLDGRANPMLGGATMLGNSGFAAAGWDFNAESARFIGQHDLSERFYLAADLLADSDSQRQSEVSLRYRLRTGYELQLVSNLDGEVFAAVAAGL